MRKLILTIIAVILSFTLSYAESCSCGQGCLSYQISGCGEQSRACCTGQWCSWGTSSCASCTATSQACSGNVTNACAGNRTRSVTGSCGSTCTYSGWNDSGCSYTQSCTATSESRNCSGNVTNACAGTQTRTRTVAGTCGSCSYNSWSSWSTNGCSYTQSCTATSESRNCSGNVSGACAGTQTRTRTVAGTCGSCSYNSWGSWTGNCTYTQSCTATSQACSGNVTNACAGNRTRTVTGTCGSCSYSGWSNSGCSYTQSCTATSESRNCSGNVTNACAGTQTRTRTVAGTCGSCSYNSWGSWSTSGCSYTQSCTATSESRNCSGNVSGACAGTQTRTRTVAGTCGSCSYNSWGSWSTSGCSYTQSCTATSESRNCSGNVTNACAGTQTRTRTVAGTCGSCSYNSWGSWTGSCTMTQSCTATSTSCSNINDGYTGGTATRTVTNSCGSCTYSSWNTSNCESIRNPAYIKLIFEISDNEMEVPYGASWSGSGPSTIRYTNEDNGLSYTTNIYRGNNIYSEPLEYGTYWGVSDLYLYSNVIMVESDTWYQVENFTERITANGKTYMLSCADDNSGSYDFYTYCDTDSGKGCSANNPWIGDYMLSCEVVYEGNCANFQKCDDTSIACSSLNSQYKSGTAWRYANERYACGTCSYSAWNTSNCSTCANAVYCGYTSTGCSAETMSFSFTNGTFSGDARFTREVLSNCGSCSYSPWTHVSGSECKSTLSQQGSIGFEYCENSLYYCNLVRNNASYHDNWIVYENFGYNNYSCPNSKTWEYHSPCYAKDGKYCWTMRTYYCYDTITSQHY